jgi:hypothetical protein
VTANFAKTTAKVEPVTGNLERLFGFVVSCRGELFVKLDSRLLSADAILEWLWNQDLLCTESGPKLRWLRSKCRMTIEIR